MSLAGTLEELPLSDILQIINLGRRTGILTLLTSEGRFTLSFRDGLVVSATAANGIPLGQTLIRHQLITPNQLTAALDVQLSGEWKPLGEILVQQGLISYDQLEEIARDELERITRRILQIQKGNFNFQVAEVPTYGNCRIDAQQLLLDTARQQDEQLQQSRLSRIETPRKAFALILNAHGELALPVRNALLDLDIEAHCVGTADSEVLAAGFEELETTALPALAIADYEELIATVDGKPGAVFERLSALSERIAVLITAEYPAQVTQAMIEELNPLRILQRPAPRHLRGSVSPQARMLLAGLIEQVTSLVSQLTSVPWPESMNLDAVSFFADLGLANVVAAQPDEGAEKRVLELLHESITQLRSPDESTEVSLLLMRLLAECFDRALFFLVRDDVLVGRGGFGFAAAAEKATVKVRKLRIPLAEAGVFGEAYATGRPFRGAMNPQWWTRYIPSEVGPGPTREAVIYPLRTQGGTVGLVYADNALLHQPLRHTHVLEIFLFQAGTALENLTLRGKLIGPKP